MFQFFYLVFKPSCSVIPLITSVGGAFRKALDSLNFLFRIFQFRLSSLFQLLYWMSLSDPFDLLIFFSCSLCSLGIHWEFICVLLDLFEQTHNHSFALFVWSLISSTSFLLAASSMGLGTLKGLGCLVFSKFLCFSVEACVRLCH